MTIKERRHSAIIVCSIPEDFPHLPELRKDPVTGRWVIIATDRSKRPSDFIRQPVIPTGHGICPFDYGNEHKTPPEILAYRDSGNRDQPGWRVRVVPNKFPVLGIEGELNRQGEGMYDKMNGIGAHEVIIETPDHSVTLGEMPERQIEEVMWAFKERVNDLKKDRRFRYILIFRNHGEAAGASLEHPHSQLIALPVIPKRVKEEVDAAKAFYDWKERCIFCDIIRHESNAAIRGRTCINYTFDRCVLLPCTPHSTRIWRATLRLAARSARSLGKVDCCSPPGISHNRRVHNRFSFTQRSYSFQAPGANGVRPGLRLPMNWVRKKTGSVSISLSRQRRRLDQEIPMPIRRGKGHAGLVHSERRTNVQRHELCDGIRMIGRKPMCDARTAVVADHGLRAWPRDASVRADRAPFRACCRFNDLAAPARFPGITVSTQIRDHHRKSASEFDGHSVPDRFILRKSVQQEKRKAGSGGEVRDLNTARWNGAFQIPGINMDAINL